MVLLADEGQVELCSVRLEIVLILMQDRCTVCTEHTIGIEIVLDALDSLLGDEVQVEARFRPFGDSATLGARLVHGLCRMYRRLRNRVGGTRWNS
jgi:hypothetical protein